MRRTILFILLIQFSVLQYGQIIADHKAVAMFDEIPAIWIDRVKSMLVEMSGESHASAFNYGQSLLQQLNSKYKTTYFGGTPPAPASNRLRLGSTATLGEQTYFTNRNAIEGYKARIAAQNRTNNPFDVMGFVWCWDTYYDPPPRGTIDPVHNVRWGGMLVGSPDGDRAPWGLDAGDSILTGNRVSMDTYLKAVDEFQQYCINNGWKTKIVFTTGPVDDSYPNSSGKEDAVQRELKHDHIRAFVLASSSRILFDYADILCWNNAGQQHTDSWIDSKGTPRVHAQIHPDNEMDYDSNWNIINGTEDGDHIGEVGAIRLMKAMWWMLARIAGWDGLTDESNPPPPTTFIYPNPSAGVVTLQIAEDSGKYNLLIFINNGSKVQQSEIDFNDFKYNLNLNHLKNGAYNIILFNDRSTYSGKLVIQK